VSLYVGVDVGGTTSTIAIGDSDRKLLFLSRQFPTRSDEGPRATIHEIVSQIDEALRGLCHPPESIGRAAIATPGPASIDGVLRHSPNLRHPEWDGCPIRELLRQPLVERSPAAEVRYIGDGQAAALGEFAIRSGQLRWAELRRPPDPELCSLFMLTVGTGLGGGEVREGRVVRGAEGRAGHAGHIMLPDDAFRYEHDRQLKVGNSRNTVEAAVSLTALTHQLPYRLSLPQWRDHPLNADSGTVREKAKRLRELAAGGDALASQLFDDQAAALGVALLCINYLGDYDLLVIGGGVCDLSETMRERYVELAGQAYHARALDGFRKLPAIEFSVCGDQASVIGALVHAYREAAQT
jgi:predicted NBD/HSP70 family sugar kinase